MKKVLFLLESLAGGGAEKVLLDIVRNIDKTLYEITVMTVVKTGIYVEEVEKNCRLLTMLEECSNNTKLEQIQYRIKYKYIYSADPKRVYQKYIKEEYDVEIAFIEGFATKVIASSTNRKSKKIAWVHTDMQKNSYADSCYRSVDHQCSVYKKFNTILFVSMSVKWAFEAKFFSTNNLRIQYNPIDNITIKRLATVPINDTDSKNIRLVTIGRLVEQKGYKRLLECCNKIKQEGYPFFLQILGTGEQEEELKDYIANNKLQDYIELVGFKKNPYPYLAHADAYVCSSYAEGFSIAATEALIVGLPIFTVDCAGMQELFGNYKCGEIVENTDDELYRMLKDVILNKLSIDSYKEDVKRRAMDFSIEGRIKEIEELFGE
ncbi:MAG: glycosyltransferase [Eubacteriales bacterium]|nr:glycosyltransferase [Eubacteriales bacterium]